MRGSIRLEYSRAHNHSPAVKRRSRRFTSFKCRSISSSCGGARGRYKRVRNFIEKFQSSEEGIWPLQYHREWPASSLEPGSVSDQKQDYPLSAGRHGCHALYITPGTPRRTITFLRLLAQAPRLLQRFCFRFRFIWVNINFQQGGFLCADTSKFFSCLCFLFFT